MVMTRVQSYASAVRPTLTTAPFESLADPGFHSMAVQAKGHCATNPEHSAPMLMPKTANSYKLQVLPPGRLCQF